MTYGGFKGQKLNNCVVILTATIITGWVLELYWGHESENTLIGQLKFKSLKCFFGFFTFLELKNLNAAHIKSLAYNVINV